jgi:hypothetical protein
MRGRRGRKREGCGVNNGEVFAMKIVPNKVKEVIQIVFQFVEKALKKPCKSRRKCNWNMVSKRTIYKK